MDIKNFNFEHKPVLLQELFENLAIKNNSCVIDATVGLAGHAAELLSKTQNLTFIGLDADPNALKIAEEKLSVFRNKHKVLLIHSNYKDIATISRRYQLATPDVIYYDLGVSSMQLDNKDRGFSFQKDGPLDMRMNPELKLSAADIVNNASETELSDIFRRFGEERCGRKIAKAIISRRKEEPFKNTLDLSLLVCSVKPRNKRAKIHPATKVFQALRIATNNELALLEQSLESALAILNKNGRIGVISFHSLEDRIVKNTFKRWAATCICPEDSPICTCKKQSHLRILTQKPIIAQEKEILDNPRSRSAKLRVVQKTTEGK